MRSGWNGRGFTALAATAAAAFLGMHPKASAQEQAPAYHAPRTLGWQAEFNGIWQTMNTANWDLRAHGASQGPVLWLGAEFSVPPGPGVIDGDRTIPYLACGGRATEEEFRQPADAGSGSEVLYGRGAAGSNT